MQFATGALTGDGTWPFIARVVGDDILCDNVVATVFGGWGDGHIADPQDSGHTASGKNTKVDLVEGVSLPMDSRFWPNMEQDDPTGFKALYGAPFPRIPWGTPVEITIAGVTFTPRDGIVDLGPGKGATKGELGPEHALDLTVLAAAHWSKMPLRQLATSFEARVWFRIIGGAKYCLPPPKASLG